MQAQYIPGVCNIGRAEVHRRRRTGWIGLFTTIILYSLFVYLGIPKIYRLMIFIPATITAIGFLQAYMHFCAYFGMLGIFNVGEEIGSTYGVEQEEFRAMDRKKALKIIIYSVIIGVSATILALIGS